MAKHLIILVHGIRDPGFWQDELRDLFENETQKANLNQPAPDVVKVETIKTEVVDIFGFIAPIKFFRQKYIDRAKEKINNLLFDKKYKDYKKTIIAHSFGTYIVANILDENINLVLDKVIMCGAIVPNQFRWGHILKINFKGNPTAIINEFSPLDIFPLLAKRVTYGFGDIGTMGAGAPIRDRNHYISHSGYLKIKFAKDYWIPFIFKDTIKKGPSKPEDFSLPWYFLLTRIPLNYMSVFIVIVLALSGLLLVHKMLNGGVFKAALKYPVNGSEEKNNTQHDVSIIGQWSPDAEDPDRKILHYKNKINKENEIENFF